MTASDRWSDRLAFIEGLRGVAVGLVLIFHAGVWSAVRGRGEQMLAPGHAGVDLFFVISGFCMMWPLVRHAGGDVRALPVGPFLRKRMLRICPPYYVALVFVAATSAVMWRLGGRSWWGHPMQSVYPIHAGNTVADALSHATFTHGFFPSYDRSVDGAFWSLSVEWQFYLVLPALVFVARRWGLRTLAIAVTALPLTYVVITRLADASLLTTAVGGDIILLRVTEFGAGMVVAHGYALRRRIPASIVAGMLVAALAVDHLRPQSSARPFFWALGFGSLVLLSGDAPALRRALEARPVRWLGRVSYSAYLTHGGVYMLVAAIETHLLLSPHLRQALFFLLGLPLALLVASVLYRAVEVPAQGWAHRRPTRIMPTPVAAEQGLPETATA